MPADIVKLYRGGSVSSLPSTIEPGALYFIKTGNNTGELYADTDNNQRIRFGSGAENIIAKEVRQWQTDGLAQSQPNVIYIFTDARQVQKRENGQPVFDPESGQPVMINVPGIKIGDGNAAIIDLPYVNVTARQINFWNNKINCILDSDYQTGGDQEMLVLTREDITHLL